MARFGFTGDTGTWARIAALSFGGPAGQIAVMHRILVDEKRWVSESQFLHALNYCMLLPGPEAMQLATYFGWLRDGVRGGLIAGGLFVLPGFISILALSMLYAGFQEVRLVDALFFGIKAAVLAVVIEALVRIGKRALKTSPMYLIAATAFVAIFAFNAPFPLIIAAAALVGFIGARIDPKRFVVITGHDVSSSELGAARGPANNDADAPGARALLLRSVRTILIWGTLWLLPIVLLLVAAGREDVFTELAIFFAKLATVTFGGAYAVLAYMAQEAVQTHGWLAPGEMLDGLGMAETTPGPLVQVVQFVGYMGAYRGADGMSPVTAGVLASLLVTWVTFIPCFLWIFLGAPFVQRLRGNAALSAALSAVTAAVVGVILNLALWFALHVLFADLREVTGLGARILMPEFATINVAAAVIATSALIAMLRFHVGLFKVLAVSAVVGTTWYMMMAAA